jgi:hypothetical protein
MRLAGKIARMEVEEKSNVKGKAIPVTGRGGP